MEFSPDQEKIDSYNSFLSYAHPSAFLFLQVVREKDTWIQETTIPVPLRSHENSWPNIEDEVPEMVDKKARRKSWHAIKFERNRNKSVSQDSPLASPPRREKRPSWWNIFAAQQWPRYCTTFCFIHLIIYLFKPLLCLLWIFMTNYIFGNFVKM